MNIAVDELAISVFRKPLTECSIAELKQLVHQYPWFGPAQLLYAKKLQAGSPALYEDQVQKTSLYFENRLWLHHLLNENESNEIITYTQPFGEENALARHAEEPGPATDSITEITVESPKEPVSIVETTVESSSIQTEIIESTEIITPQYPEEEKIPAGNKEGPEPVSDILPQSTETIEEIDDRTDETGAVIEVPDEESEVETKTEPFVELPRIRFQPINTMNAPLTFEPYHTIDYFASQGIKVKEDEKPKDRFDQQLKSFTEWLKAMKRVTPTEIAATTADPGGEKKVEQLAEHSLAERHIVTEAMAEVWVKQGNIAKAEEIYRKLSLLDPPKTAYFAAKIEDLKKTS